MAFDGKEEVKKKKKKGRREKGGPTSADEKCVYGNASEIGQKLSVLFQAFQKHGHNPCCSNSKY